MFVFVLSVCVLTSVGMCDIDTCCSPPTKNYQSSAFSRVAYMDTVCESRGVAGDGVVLVFLWGWKCSLGGVDVCVKHMLPCLAGTPLPQNIKLVGETCSSMMVDGVCKYL